MRNTSGIDSTVSLYYEGYSAEEIAAILNKPIERVIAWLTDYLNRIKQPISPLPKDFLQRRAQALKKGNEHLYQQTELGIEKLCPRCKEYWPADTEFFHLSSGNYGDGLYTYCRACSMEIKRNQQL